MPGYRRRDWAMSLMCAWRLAPPFFCLASPFQGSVREDMEASSYWWEIFSRAHGLADSHGEFLGVPGRWNFPSMLHPRSHDNPITSLFPLLIQFDPSHPDHSFFSSTTDLCCSCFPPRLAYPRSTRHAHVTQPPFPPPCLDRIFYLRPGSRIFSDSHLTRLQSCESNSVKSKNLNCWRTSGLSDKLCDQHLSTHCEFGRVLQGDTLITSLTLPRHNLSNSSTRPNLTLCFLLKLFPSHKQTEAPMVKDSHLKTLAHSIESPSRTSGPNVRQRGNII